MQPDIGQSSVIAFSLLAAFIVFITARGELSAYVGFFGKPQGSSGPTSPNVQNSAGGWINLSQNSGNPTDQLSTAQALLLQGAQLAIIA